MTAFAARIVAAWMRWDLRRSFQRVEWHSAWPPALPDDRPVVACANHHHFYDGHLLWYLLDDTLNRPGTVWMQDWNRFPFFAPVGALPFPTNDSRTRASTVRRTARRLHNDAKASLIYFPSGELQSPNTGIGPYAVERFTRIHRLYPKAVFWPVALHVTWDGAPYPVAQLCGGPSLNLDHHAPGSVETYLRRQWHALRETTTAPTHLLMDGRTSPANRWGFAWTLPLFKRLMPP
jgi:1-acyl-sn-glycerol-3-phosphate acyltransferase